MKNSILCLAVLLMWLAHFIVDVMIGIWPIYKSLIDLNLAKAGLVVALGAFIGEGSQIIFATLSDKGYGKAMIGCGLAMVSAAAFMPYFSNYAAFFLLYLVTCLGSGAFHPSAAGLMNILRPKRRSLLVTIFASGVSFGLAFSQIIFTSVYFSLPGQSYLLLIPGFLLIAVLLFYNFPEIKEAGGRGAHKTHIKDFITFFKRTDLRLLYFTLVANQTLFWAVIFILPNVLKSLEQIDWVCYGGGHMCLILGGAMMMAPAGLLADRYSARNVILAASVIGFALFYILLFFGNLSATFVLINLFILGACLAVIQPVGGALGGKLEPNKPSMVSAFLMGMVWCVAEALGPGGVGLISTLFEDNAPVKALAVIGVFFPVSIYCSWSLSKDASNLNRAVAKQEA